MAFGKSKAEFNLENLTVETGRVEFHLIGNTPLIYHAFSQKAVRELLNPSGRKTAADKAANTKHNPPEEYRGSMYRTDDNENPTRLIFPATGFKSALVESALDVPGAVKKTLNRLLWVDGAYVDVYGVPRLHMDIVRMADIARTPDIRTRAILPLWATKVSINYSQPTITAKGLSALMQHAGMFFGIGDKRQEKGAGNFGTWRICAEDDPDYLAIVDSMGREAQDEAIAHPVCYDDQTQQLHDWWVEQQMKKDPSLRLVA